MWLFKPEITDANQLNIKYYLCQKLLYMRILLYAVLLLISFGCNPNQTNKEVDIDAVYQKNIKDSVLATGWYFVVERDSNAFVRQESLTGEPFRINPRPIVVAAHIRDIELGKNSIGDMFVNMLFDKQGTELWSQATQKAINSHLVFIIDDEIYATPRVNAQITGGRSGFGREDCTESDYIALIQKIKQEGGLE